MKRYTSIYERMSVEVGDAKGQFRPKTLDTPVNVTSDTEGKFKGSFGQFLTKYPQYGKVLKKLVVDHVDELEQTAQKDDPKFPDITVDAKAGGKVDLVIYDEAGKELARETLVV